MFELPLFPLNTVLFPATPLQLHIFEPRYKKMINLCIQERRPFGVVLIRLGAEALGPLPEPYPVGCSAEIIHVQRLSEGRLNITALGQKRFQIISIDSESEPYLVGSVEDFQLTNPYPEIVERKASDLRPKVERFIQALARAGGGQFDVGQLPPDPISLAYIAAAMLQIPPLEKQRLLAFERADELLAELLLTYRRENALLPSVLSDTNPLQQGGFSRN